MFYIFALNFPKFQLSKALSFYFDKSLKIDLITFGEGSP